MNQIEKMLKGVINHLQASENVFGGLPELTNANGETCWGSCPTQAWSNSVFIELENDLKSL